MKILSLLILIFSSNLTNAIGWDELSKESAIDRKIDISVVYDGSGACHKIEALLPTKIMFEELGARELWSVHYRTIKEKVRGWQLNSKGTEILLPTEARPNNQNIVSICLSDPDFMFGYLSAIYGGPQGTAPMVVLLKLSDFK